MKNVEEIARIEGSLDALQYIDQVATDAIKLYGGAYTPAQLIGVWNQTIFSLHRAISDAKHELEQATRVEKGDTVQIVLIKGGN